jgi:hypothetical protein
MVVGPLGANNPVGEFAMRLSFHRLTAKGFVTQKVQTGLRDRVRWEG